MQSSQIRPTCPKYYLCMHNHDMASMKTFKESPPEVSREPAMQNVTIKQQPQPQPQPQQPPPRTNNHNQQPTTNIQHPTTQQRQQRQQRQQQQQQQHQQEVLGLPCHLTC